jgi:hypothetical protein
MVLKEKFDCSFYNKKIELLDPDPHSKFGSGSSR